jgi:hypothetical protein
MLTIREGFVQVAALVAVLKVGRSLQLVNSLREVALPGEPPLLISEELLSHAITSSNEALRLDALELACLHPRASTPPGPLFICGCAFAFMVAPPDPRGLR